MLLCCIKLKTHKPLTLPVYVRVVKKPPKQQTCSADGWNGGGEELEVMMIRK